MGARIHVVCHSNLLTRRVVFREVVKSGATVPRALETFTTPPHVESTATPKKRGHRYGFRWLRRVGRIPSKLWVWLVVCERAARRYRSGRVRTILRAAHLRVRHGFTAKEVHLVGLLDPSRYGFEKRMMSRRHLFVVQKILNRGSGPRARLRHGSAVRTVENKAIFAFQCDAEGLAAPRLYAVLGQELDEWVWSERKPESRADWISFFNESLPGEFVVKPVDGVYGWGFRLFSRRADRFIDHCGVSLSAGELHDELTRNQRFAGWLIQERLHNHPALKRLCGGRGLATVRVNTILLDGAVHILSAHLRVVCGDNVVDNFHGGINGNLCATVTDLRRGVLRAGLGIDNDGAGRWVQEHPNTGLSIEGFELPLWDQVVTLSKKALLAFGPLRAVGWDVAMTPAGPALVEGNAYFDPPPYPFSLEAFSLLERAQREARPGANMA